MSMEVNFPEDLMSELFDTSFDEIAKEALEAASPVLVRSSQNALQRSVSSRGTYSKGVMVPTTKATKAKKTKTDAWIVTVRPVGKDAKGVRNSLKAGVLEYGSAHEAARPWLTNASKNAEAEATEKMQEVYNRKVGAK